MNWIIGLLIVVLGLTLLISGVTGTAGQVYSAVTGRGAGSSSSSGGFTPRGFDFGNGNGVLPPIGTAPGAAFNLGTP